MAKVINLFKLVLFDCVFLQGVEIVRERLLIRSMYIEVFPERGFAMPDPDPSGAGRRRRLDEAAQHLAPLNRLFQRMQRRS